MNYRKLACNTIHLSHFKSQYVFSFSSVFFHWNSRLENAPAMDTVLLQKGQAKVEFSKQRKQRNVGCYRLPSLLSFLGACTQQRI